MPLTKSIEILLLTIAEARNTLPPDTLNALRLAVSFLVALNKIIEDLQE
jgi:hypothetical protein